MTEQRRPIQIAAATRKSIIESGAQNTWMQTTITPPEAALLNTIPASIQRKPLFSLLFQTDPLGSHVTVVTGTHEVALQALRGWAQDTNPKIAAQFTQWSYHELYQTLQTGRINGKSALSGPGKLLLAVLAEQDEFWQGIIDRMEGAGAIDEIDFEPIQERLQTMWHMLSKAQKQNMAAYSPQNLFKE